jgi:hypothetical protein
VTRRGWGVALAKFPAPPMPDCPTWCTLAGQEHADGVDFEGTTSRHHERTFAEVDWLEEGFPRSVRIEIDQMDAVSVDGRQLTRHAPIAAVCGDIETITTPETLRRIAAAFLDGADALTSVQGATR